MAVFAWPMDHGYADFSAMQRRSRGPIVHRSVFTGASQVSYGGGKRWQGSVTTPVSVRTGAVPMVFESLVASLADVSNQLRLILPDDAGGTQITVAVLSMDPPERDERGVWRGWRLNFLETLVTAGSVVSGLPLDVRGDLKGAGDVDRYEFSFTREEDTLIVLDELPSGHATGAYDIELWWISVGSVGPAVKTWSYGHGFGVTAAQLQRLPAGAGYLQVTSRSAATDTGYRLRAQILQSPVLTRSRIYNGQIIGPSIADIYPFALATPGRIRLTMYINSSGPSGILGLTLFAATYSVIDMSSSNGETVGPVEQSLPAGEYALVIRYAVSTTNTRYTVLVDLLP